jgi:hypothetical protein
MGWSELLSRSGRLGRSGGACAEYLGKFPVPQADSEVVLGLLPG